MNKASSLPTYHQRMDRVAEHISANLDGPIDLLILAEVANLSSYHFHRIYHAIAGETVAATIKRLRMQRAVTDLVQSGRSIKEIAARSGYHDVSVFSRVFKQTYGIPPAQYRSQGSHQRFQVLEQRAALNGEVRLLELPALYGVGVEHRGSYLQIARGFNVLFRWAQSHGAMDQVSHVVGIYPDDPFAVPETQLRSTAALMLGTEVAFKAPLESTTISAGMHAVLRHQGPYADMRLAYQGLYGEWLPRSGFWVNNAPVFEIYLNHPKDTAPRDLLVDICLPIRWTV